MEAAISFFARDHIRALAKAVSWRIVGAFDTFLISFLITGHAGAASAIVGIEAFTKIGLYYAHERAWYRVR